MRKSRISRLVVRCLEGLVFGLGYDTLNDQGVLLHEKIPVELILVYLRERAEDGDTLRVGLTVERVADHGFVEIEFEDLVLVLAQRGIVVPLPLVLEVLEVYEVFIGLGHDEDLMAVDDSLV